MTLKRECATCFIPIKLMTTDGYRWQWVHDASLHEILLACIRIGVPPRHSLTRLSPTFKEASFVENGNENNDAA